MGGGEAVAATLLGDQSPAGRSVVTWYSSTADLPKPGSMTLYKNPAKGNMHGVTYRYYQGPPVRWGFGYGLSYTTFAYSSFKLDKPSYQPCEPIVVTVSVKNTGAVASDEVVQVYIKQPGASFPVPNVRLGAFKRVHVPAGGTITVSLTVKPEAHSVVTSDAGGEAIYVASADQQVEKGSIELHVGGGQVSCASPVIYTPPCKLHTVYKYKYDVSYREGCVYNGKRWVQPDYYVGALMTKATIGAAAALSSCTK